MFSPCFQWCIFAVRKEANVRNVEGHCYKLTCINIYFKLCALLKILLSNQQSYYLNLTKVKFVGKFIVKSTLRNSGSLSCLLCSNNSDKVLNFKSFCYYF